jgi:hypothetical protein
MDRLCSECDGRGSRQADRAFPYPETCPRCKGSGVEPPADEAPTLPRGRMVLPDDAPTRPETIAVPPEARRPKE